MVEQLEDGKWKPCAGVDLNKVAKAVGTNGAGKRQHEKHLAERRMHGRDLLIGATKEPDDRYPEQPFE